MRSTVPWLLAAAALGWGASAQVSRIGAFPSHQEDSHFDLPLEVDSSGAPRGKSEVRDVRQHIVVPDFYGRLVAVTQDGGRALLWFQGENGVVRNVVTDASSVPLAIEQRAATGIISRVAR
jgi:hypothetical protein